MNKLESPSPKDALCHVWMKLDHAVVLEKNENVKSLQTDGRTDRQTDDGQQVIRKLT